MPPAQRPRPIPRRVRVARIEELSPAMRRLTFEGPDLATFAWSGPAAHVKLIFPDPTTGVIPEFSPERRPATMRTYTPRRFDATTGPLQIDFVLHGIGVASTWVSHAQVGGELVLLGPAPGYEIDPRAAWYVLACDETALPAVETLLEALPRAMSVTVFAQVGDAREERPLPGPSATNVHWILRGSDGEVALAAALERFGWPEGNGRVYVGCEAGQMRRIRKDLVETAGFERTRITTRGYWRLGAANHPDRDYGDD